MRDLCQLLQRFIGPCAGTLPILKTFAITKKILDGALTTLVEFGNWVWALILLNT